MFFALTLLTVYLANIAPGGRVALYFLCSMFIFGIMLEQMLGAALIVFAAVTFIGFIIVPDKAGMLPYLLFFGHYGIFKAIAEQNTSGGTLLTLKLVYYNVCIALIYFFGGGFMLALVPFELPFWLIILLGEVIFLVYDWLFSKLGAWYAAGVRGKLVGNSWS